MILRALKNRVVMLFACAGLAILFVLAIPAALIAPVGTARWIRDFARRGIGE